MSRILVLYYSRSGNTEKMATAVAEGAKNAGNAEVELSYHVDADDLSNFDAIILGAPTYHHDMPMDMKRLFEDAAAKGMNLKGKVGAAFGSYGWSGEAPKAIARRLADLKMRVIGEPATAQLVPTEADRQAARELGANLAQAMLSRPN